ncbi:oxidoreductase [Streptoalloteichus hindustanus]|uniref:NAD(P)-dependent dehydrogenase, short-chain alcohol dehydrogenase family n=1 Tax=Streptoalloteichus hindustanus TaxID=2017 RepID=A0A1M4ZE74_STRHI|nr:oxidoreductase [Streptoalloteichus hindustanus]SHF16301.1 NAD(P)-dependent dehydrogenase, short-chain alcohol dehydrogenase family [Streptoalloteichus hindustanus]
MSEWTEDHLPDQRGRVAVVTGANTGIGFATARALAARGAHVVLACRDLDRARTAVDRIAQSAPEARLDVVRLDLASLASVRAAAEEIRERLPRIDLLVNNAGITGLRGRTGDGFEVQFGVNHLGHFALTGLVLDRLLPVPGSRVVTVSSIAHRYGRIDDVDDLRPARDTDTGARPENSVFTYARSKLANLMFTYELQRRLSAAGAPTTALAAHPGGASTEIFRNSPGWFRAPNLLIAKLLGRSPEMGALPTLRAAADPEARGGEYYGPGGLFEVQGYPRRVASSPRSRDADNQRRLWEASERLTEVIYPF